MAGDRYPSSLDWGDVCDGLRLRLVSSLRDAERERLIGGDAYATTNQITLAATLPNADSRRLVNCEERSHKQITHKG